MFLTVIFKFAISSEQAIYHSVTPLSQYNCFYQMGRLIDRVEETHESELQLVGASCTSTKPMIPGRSIQVDGMPGIYITFK